MEEIVALVSGGPTGPRQGAKNSISAVRLRAAASERPNSSRSRQYRGPSPTAELLKSCSSVLTLMQHLSRSIVVLQYDVVDGPPLDRKSTRLNSSHSQISYAVFCLKKKNTQRMII